MATIDELIEQARSLGLDRAAVTAALRRVFAHNEHYRARPGPLVTLQLTQEARIFSKMLSTFLPSVTHVDHSSRSLWPHANTACKARTNGVSVGTIQA